MHKRQSVTMKKNRLFQSLLVLSLCMLGTRSLAGSGTAVHSLLLHAVAPVALLQDSVPTKAAPESGAKETTADAIKSVPKARKQEVPIPVTTTTLIKPIQIIRPKIIKPVIRIH